MNTVLFDLDGTLLPIDMAEFERIYAKELVITFKDIMPPEELGQIVWESTKALVENTEYKTNEEVFMEELSKRTNKDINIFKKKFDYFYDTNFSKLKEAVQDVEAMRKSVNILKQKGYTVAVATNPLFPIKAINYRITWAGFKPEDFIYISCFEKNHYCKPQLKYYEEVLKDLNKLPDECLMVGNDVEEDLIAKKLGLKTYLITNNILHRSKNEIITDYLGEYDDFYKFVKSLPKIN